LSLDHYPNLRVFVMRFEGKSYRRRTACDNISNIELAPVCSVIGLRLAGSISSALYLGYLFNFFPNVTSVSLEEVTAHSRSIAIVLSIFPRQTQIDHLIVKANYKQHPLDDGTLRRFSNLVSLNLDRSVYNSTVVPIIQTAFKNLRQLYTESKVNHRDVRRLCEENKALDLLYVDEISVRENKDRISPISTAFGPQLFSIPLLLREWTEWNWMDQRFGK